MSKMRVELEDVLVRLVIALALIMLPIVFLVLFPPGLFWALTILFAIAFILLVKYCEEER